MRIIILLTLLSNLIYAQKLVKIPYQNKVDSIIEYQLPTRFKKTDFGQNYVYTYIPSSKVKISLKTSVNYSYIQRVNYGMSNFFGEFELEDYGLFAYDLRIKYYITKKFRLLVRTYVANKKTSTYTFGLFIKF